MVFDGRLGELVVVRVGDQVVPDPVGERLHYGQRVTVLGIGCPAYYRTDRALAVVAPQSFGFDFDFTPIEDLRGYRQALPE